MARSWARRVFAMVVAGAIALAYVQVAQAPASVAPPRPTVGAIVAHVQADVQWFRTAIPRDASWWKSAYAVSSENLRVLEAVLTEPGTTP